MLYATKFYSFTNALNLSLLCSFVNICSSFAHARIIFGFLEIACFSNSNASGYSSNAALLQDFA